MHLHLKNVSPGGNNIIKHTFETQATFHFFKGVLGYGAGDVFKPGFLALHSKKIFKLSLFRVVHFQI